MILFATFIIVMVAVAIGVTHAASISSSALTILSKLLKLTAYVALWAVVTLATVIYLDASKTPDAWGVGAGFAMVVCIYVAWGIRVHRNWGKHKPKVAAILVRVGLASQEKS